jgi:hypothetical protein
VSHFTINTPEFFNYRASVKGYLQLPAALRDTRKESANFMVTTNTEIQRSSTGMSTSIGNNTTTGTFEFQFREYLDNGKYSINYRRAIHYYYGQLYITNKP